MIVSWGGEIMVGQLKVCLALEPCCMNKLEISLKNDAVD